MQDYTKHPLWKEFEAQDQAPQQNTPPQKDYTKHPLWKEFEAQDQAPQQNTPPQKDYTNHPLWKEFEEHDTKEQKLLKEFNPQELKNKQTRLDKIDEYVPDFAEDFVHGSARNIADYTASFGKLIGSDTLQHKGRLASETLQKNIDNEWVGMAGEMIGDPLNLTPAGIVSKGQKLGKLGTMLTKTKKRAVGTSMALGAGVGAGTMVAKNYGNDNMSEEDKELEMQIGAGFVSVINGALSSGLFGKFGAKAKESIVNGIKKYKNHDISDDDIAKAMLNNNDEFGLSKQEAEQVVNKFYTYSQEYQNKFNVTNPKMDKKTALNILAREANRKRIERGEAPIYPEMQEQYRTESIYPQRVTGESTTTQNFVGGDFNKNMPIKYGENTADDLERRYTKIASHPRLKELLQMREGVLAKDSKSPQNLVSKRDIRQSNSGNGWETEVTPASYEKNYNYDFELTKQDIHKLYNGKHDEDLIYKLETDLSTLDNHPDWAKSANDAPEVKMSDEDWDEANSVFSKGVDNLAVGTYAGIEQDENGNISFDPEKFIIGLGGYTAVKTALKNKKVQGVLKDYAEQAIAKVDFNPEVQKQGNSFNSMFVGSKGNEKGSFSDVATKQTMREIDDSQINYKPIPKQKVEFDGREFEQNYANLGDIIDHPELFKKYPDLKDMQVSINSGYGKGGSYNAGIDGIALDGGNVNKIEDEATQALRSAINELDRNPIDDEYARLNAKFIDEATPSEELVAINEAIQKTPTAKRMDELKVELYKAKDNAKTNGAKALNKDGKSTLLHEVQHSIQEREKWAKGGNVEEFKQEAQLHREINKEIDKIDKALGHDEWWSNNIDTIVKELKGKPYEQDRARRMFAETLAPDIKEKYLNKLSEARSIQKENKELVGLKDGEFPEPYDSYKRLHGEQLARATQYRMDMTPQERMAESPYDTLMRVEGEIKDPIVRFDNDGVSEMSPVKSKSQKEKRGIYNVAFNGKNATEVRKADGSLIEFAKGNRKYGAEHIKVRHIGDGKDGELTDIELLNIGNTIRSGEIEKKGSKHIYTHFDNKRNRLRAVVGKNNDGETVISYYSNRSGGSHNAQPTPLSVHENIIPQEAEKIKRDVNLEEWHKDSSPLTKNEDGTPKAFYHGTKGDFEEFKGLSTKANGSRSGKGFYFTADTNIANSYGKNGNVMPVYLNAKNIFRGIDTLDSKQKEYYLTTEKPTNEILKYLGFDGRAIDEKEIVVFEPNQIKSINNKGTFDKNNPNILQANGMHSMAGGFAGGSDALINQRDYDGDGEFTGKDLAYGAGAGVGGIHALKKVAPSLFKDGSKGGMKAGLFAGSKAKGYDAKAQAGKTFEGKYDTLSRFEIDDSQATVDFKMLDNMIQYDYEVPLHHILKHEELYENYPQLQGTRIELVTGSSSFFDAKSGKIGISAERLLDDKMDSTEKVKSALLHEIQHAIQKEEGFARGGSAQEFYNDAKRKINLLKYELEFEPDEFIQDKMMKKLQKLEETYQTKGKEEAFEMYKKLAGEIEARDVQARINYTAKQREEISPYSSENIAPEDANVRFNNANDDLVKNMSEQAPENSQSKDDFIGDRKKSIAKKVKDAVDFKATKSEAGFMEHDFADLEVRAKEANNKEFKDISQNNSPFQNVKNTFKKLFTDTMSADYHMKRDTAHAYIQEKSIKLERLAKSLGDLSDETDKELYRYLTKTGGENLSDNLKSVADDIRYTIDELGKQLVDDGLLDERAYKDWMGQYLHRSYEPHMNVKGMFKKGFKIDKQHERGLGESFKNVKDAIGWLNKNNILKDSELVSVSSFSQLERVLKDKGKLGALSDGKISMQAEADGKFKFRRDWNKAEREAMGEVESAKYAVPETLMKLNRMLEHSKFLKEVEGVNGAVLSKKQAKELSYQEKKGGGFEKLEGIEYGALSGKWVRTDIADDVGRMYKDIANTHHDAFRMWNQYHGLWKKSKTVWNPTAHVNNFGGNVFLMHLGGMSSNKIGSVMKNGYNSMKSYKRFEELEIKRLRNALTNNEKLEYIKVKEAGKIVEEARKLGVFGKSQLNDILAGVQDDVVKRGVLSKIDDKMSKAYEFEDNFNRLSFYLTIRQTGKTPQEAKQMVDFMLPDYSKPLPKGWRMMRDSSIAPFISWSYYTMPSIVKMLNTKRGATSAVKVVAALSAMEYMLTGGDITPMDNIPFIDTDKPEDFKGRRFAVGKSGDNVHTLKLDRLIPYAELQNPLNFAKSQFGGMATSTAHLMTGTQFYNGRPITYDNKSAGDQTIDYAKHIANQYTPVPAPVMSGVNIIDKLARGKERTRRSKTIQPRTLIQDLAKIGGANTMTYSKRGLKKEQQD